MSVLAKDGSVILTPTDAKEIAGVLALCAVCLGDTETMAGLRVDVADALCKLGHGARGERLGDMVERVIAKRLEEAEGLGRVREPTIPTMGDSLERAGQVQSDAAFDAEIAKLTGKS